MEEIPSPEDLIPGWQPVSEKTARNWSPYKVATRLEAARRWRGLTQQELARYTGLSLATIRRIDSGEHTNPHLRHLINCALVLDFPLPSLIEPEWCEWFQARPAAPEEAPDLDRLYGTLGRKISGPESRPGPPPR